ncbi:ATP phosphoribosyltransferase 1, chloroplastic [Tanacetum coccineum]
MVENQLIIENKVVRSHIGGEYVFPFLNLCAQLRIRHKFIALDTPTRELLKEKNRALEDMVNAMFLSPGLSHAMWGKAIISGFRQRDGLDYFDTYSPVTRITSIRMVLAIAALRNLEVHQMDMKMTFLNGDLEEEIYMNQPEGFMAPGLVSKVCRLVKSLYDSRKAPKQGHQFLSYHVRMWI